MEISYLSRRWNLPEIRGKHRLLDFVEANGENDLGLDAPWRPVVCQVDDGGPREGGGVDAGNTVAAGRTGRGEMSLRPRHGNTP